MRAAVQHHAADQLHVEVPHVQRATTGLADDREGIREDVVERLAVGDPLPELRGSGFELIVGERLQRRFEFVDLGDERTQALQLAFVLCADDLGEERIENQGWEPVSPAGS